MSVVVNILRVFLPFAAGYFLSYIFRVVNAVIAPDLIADIGVGPSALGLLTAVYFITFAAFQLPLGILLDRFGPRRVEALLLLFCAFGTVVFSRAESLAGLVAGRALIGFGVSSCLMAAFKAYTLWFSPERWTRIYGFQMAAGGFGALVATSPVEISLRYIGWRGVFLALAVGALVVAGAVFFFVPEKKLPSDGGGNLTAGIYEIFTSAEFWRIAPLATMCQATFLAVQGLWAGPWLASVGGLGRQAVAGVLFWLAVAMVAGYLLQGGVTEWLDRRGVRPATTAVTGMALFMVSQFLLVLGPVGWAVPLWIVFGFFGTSSIIAYSVLSRSFPVHLSGRVTTATNLLVFVTAFAGQWAIGAIIGACSGGSAALSPVGFQWGFGIMLLLQVIGLIIYLFSPR